MRSIVWAGLGLSLMLSAPVSAQVQQNNPKAANQSLERGSEMCSMRQDMTTQGDMNRMQMERDQAGTFAPNTGPNALPIGRGTGVGVVR